MTDCWGSHRGKRPWVSRLEEIGYTTYRELDKVRGLTVLTLARWPPRNWPPHSRRNLRNRRQTDVSRQDQHRRMGIPRTGRRATFSGRHRKPNVRAPQNRRFTPHVRSSAACLQQYQRPQLSTSVASVQSVIDVQFAMCTAIYVNSRTSIHRSRRYEGGHDSCRSASHWRAAGEDRESQAAWRS